MWQEISAQIREVTQTDFEIKHHRSVGGGSINQAYAVSSGDHAYFVKLNAASGLLMFEAEARDRNCSLSHRSTFAKHQ
ncbi:MAG: fructosamine kinase family protein [Leptolyngbya sp. SIO1E4]|nr:fructosamine kinase family protein [Leptolyngbya sp. SIO1E4]